jgi:ElaB/YqjD/DUF883 family membrane-anchored ribosome-binding protein
MPPDCFSRNNPVAQALFQRTTHPAAAIRRSKFQLRRILDMALANKRIRSVKAVEDTAEAAKDSVTAMAGEARKDLGEFGESIAANAQQAVSTVSDRLKSVGVDPDILASVAKDQASNLQQFIAEELKTRPVRALGVAAAVGLVLGLMTTR